MREIFEKIIKDSVESIAEGVLNEFTSHKKHDTTIRGNEIHYNDDKSIIREEINVRDEKKRTQNHIQNCIIDGAKIEKEHPLTNEFTRHYKPILGNDNSDEIGVINAQSRNKRLNIMIACAAAGLVLCVMILASYKGSLPGEVVGIISTVSGIFGSCLKDAYSFEFGSSRGSKDKDDKISAAIIEKFKR